MLSEMEYGQHFWKYPKDKTFLIQMQFYSNRVIKQRKTNNLVQLLQKSDQKYESYAKKCNYEPVGE